MKKLSILSTLIIAFSLSSCFNPHGDTINTLRTSEQNYQNYRATADGIRNTNLMNRAINQSNGVANGCVQYNGRQIIFGNLADGLVTRERATRELRGGATCRCVPMGTTCAARSCLCSEICPSDERILSARAHQIAPRSGNVFPFTNSTGYNTSIFRNSPLTNGYCTGFVHQRRNFSLLADFQDEMVTIPAMEIPSATWVSYTQAQMLRLSRGEQPHFIGLESLDDLNRPGLHNVELKAYLMTIMNWNSWPTDQIRNDSILVSDHLEGGLKNIDPIFTHENANRYPGRQAVDPQTNTVIPVQGTPEYDTYLSAQVTKVLRGEPALIPGFRNLRTLAEHPTYGEMIGDAIVRDWRDSNAIDGTWNNESHTNFTRNKDPLRTMTANEINSVWDQVTNGVPVYNPSTYPMDSHGNLWNSNGPFGTLAMDIRGSIRNASGTVINDGYHAVEAYAHYTLPDGTRKICIADPNFRRNDNCSINIEIPPAGNPSFNGMQSWGSGPAGGTWTLGTFDLANSATGHLGQIITKNINYCRQINANNFAQNDCGN